MSNSRILTWASIAGAITVWNLFSPWLHKVLIDMGLSVSIVKLILLILPLILLMEVVTKLLLLQAVSPVKFIATEAKSWPQLDHEKLSFYTFELQKLGFVQLIDYTFSSAPGMARLFAHPEKSCFAEVGQVGSLPMFCSISCRLEKRWLLAVTNTPSNPSTDKVWYAFLRQPRILVRRFDHPPSELLKSLLKWHQQVSTTLGVEILKDMTAEAYFAEERRKRMQQRQSLIRKSIIWGLLEMLWFSFNPKSEWLGEYAKFQVSK